MPELGNYGVWVISSYAAAVFLILGIVFVSLLQRCFVRRAIERLEEKGEEKV